MTPVQLQFFLVFTYEQPEELKLYTGAIGPEGSGADSCIGMCVATG
ncbi:MAG: hypothetical protein R3D55_16190 [Chloroflexota bacterium]